MLVKKRRKDIRSGRRNFGMRIDRRVCYEEKKRGESSHRGAAPEFGREEEERDMPFARFEIGYRGWQEFVMSKGREERSAMLFWVQFFKIRRRKHMDLTAYLLGYRWWTSICDVDEEAMREKEGFKYSKAGVSEPSASTAVVF
jgi:hypothetical protein